jgi:hypothetical protein
MSAKPPLLPAEIVRRMLRVASFDGGGLLIVGGLFALVSAMSHDGTGTAISLMIAGAGAIELHGVAVIRLGEERGLRWLVSSQLCVIAIITSFAVDQLSHVDTADLRHMVAAFKPYFPEDAWDANVQTVRSAIAEDGLTVDGFLRMLYIATYRMVILATFVYQGGMSVYYMRRRDAVVAAISSHPES